MTAASRAKGATAERELARLARDALGEGFAVERNHSQTAIGGHDLLGIGGFATEVKRAETLRLRPWWAQTVAQARTAALTPALAFRRSREPWGVLVPWRAVSPEPLPGAGCGRPFALDVARVCWRGRSSAWCARRWLAILSEDALRLAAEIKVRAQRRMGELLKAMEKAPGARETGTDRGATRSQGATASLSELGITKSQSNRSQQIASVPEPDFEAAHRRGCARGWSLAMSHHWTQPKSMSNDGACFSSPYAPPLPALWPRAVGPAWTFIHIAPGLTD